MRQSAQSDVITMLQKLHCDGKTIDAGRAMSPLIANSHVHLPPNFSAFDSVEQLLDQSHNQNIAVLGASNYYDFAVYEGFASGARKRGIFPLFGVEIVAMVDELVRSGVRINDPGNPGKMYVCGKGIVHFADPSPTARALLEVIRRNDSDRMREMTCRLEKVFAENGVPTGLDAEAIIERVMKRHDAPRQTVWLQERHLAQAFAEAFIEKVSPDQRVQKIGEVLGATVTDDASNVAKLANVIRSQLMKADKRAFVEESYVNFDQAKELILALGGIPCYPTLADGAKPICEYEHPPRKLVENILSSGIYCAELIPVRNTREKLVEYVHALRSAGIVVLAGTEHNTPGMMRIEPACADGESIPAQVKDIFWEGACVVAAHQALAARSECGYVNSNGDRSPDFSDDEERICWFAALGAGVIADYQKRMCDDSI